ncbi:response regulator transcription factor [Perlabentimonas gracilis]|uniref:response regulator transcription factor n=1 Tax=Perlabentimonas gracilis TaxID=2715279 RepID=UPI00140B98D0|nr:response regulator transcription factor [Perlabentimonas gracilis]NHB70001.1 response regulator transcription factor [Perlabentimonas gracilis]
MTIKTIIVDDHRILRDGIKALLKEMPNVELVGEAANGKELLPMLRDCTVNLILMDINMPEMNGIDASREALRICPDVKIIILSMHDDIQYYDSIVQLGVDGFLLKESSYDELEKAIESVFDGRPYFSQELLLKLLKSKRQEPEIVLTRRERDVLQLICQGLSTSEIAAKLFLSVSSIEKYRAELLLKTNSPNSTALAVFAIKSNLVDL